MIPQEVRELFAAGRLAWLATADGEGVPNVAPMLQYWWADEKTIVVGDLFMKATKANVEATGKACLAVYDESSDKSYKLKGRARYETSGPLYDLAQGELAKRKPDKKFKGVVALRVRSVYDLSRGPRAGALIAEV